MSDMIDAFRDLKDYRRARRIIWGVPCPRCREEQPKREPTLLEPGRLCRVHKPAYRDPRPAPSDEEFDARMRVHGWGLAAAANEARTPTKIERKDVG